MNPYQSLMGMSEMESAVKIMVDIARERDISFEQVVVGVNNFISHSDSRQYAMIGFCHLCIKGWIESRYPNCSFFPTEELVQRVVERFPLLDKKPKILAKNEKCVIMEIES